MEVNKVYLGDSLELARTLPDESIDCVVTSPPYFALRDYGVDGQIGAEKTPEEYINRLVELFREVRRALKPGGVLWVNIGDSYCGTRDKGDYRDPKYPAGRNAQGVSRNAILEGYKQKDLIGVPWMLAFALRADGWYLRQDIIWSKPNPMPESVTDRCTKSHEYIFLLSKSKKYYFDSESIMEACADQERTNYQSGSRTYGENKDRNDNDFGERSKVWKPRVKKGHKFGGNKYGKNDDRHFNTYSGNDYVPRTKNVQYDGQRQNSFHLSREAGIPDEEYTVRNKRDVWVVPVKPNREAHFATYPEELITPCVLAGCPEGGVVLDPFMGSGTTGIVARKLGRKYIGFELNPEYQKMATRRIFNEGENLFNQEP